MLVGDQRSEICASRLAPVPQKATKVAAPVSASEPGGGRATTGWVVTAVEPIRANADFVRIGIDCVVQLLEYTIGQNPWHNPEETQVDIVYMGSQQSAA